MANLDELKAGVGRSLPEVFEIEDEILRGKVIEAWALGLSQTEFTSVDQIRASGNPDTPAMLEGTQSDHIRGVTRMAMGLADELERVVGNVGIDRDLLIASALCHDLGKPFEFSPSNQERWQSNPAASGFPAIRHPAYGVHLALTVGLPEAVAHAAGCHSGEGELVVRGLENTIVHNADRAFWSILERAGRLETEN